MALSPFCYLAATNPNCSEVLLPLSKSNPKRFHVELHPLAKQYNFFALYACARKEKNNLISARKGNARKEGQVFQSGNVPSPYPRQYSLSHCCTGCACRAPGPCQGQEPSLGPPGSMSLALAAVWELPESTNPVLFLLGCFSAVLSLQRAQRWCSSGGHSREQRGWGGFCSPCVPPWGHLAPVTWCSEVAVHGLHPAEETGKGGPGMVLVMGLKLQGAGWHRGGGR